MESARPHELYPIEGPEREQEQVDDKARKVNEPSSIDVP